MHGNVLSCGMLITVVISSSFASSSKKQKITRLFANTRVKNNLILPSQSALPGLQNSFNSPSKNKNLHVSSYLLFINTRQKQTFTPFILSSLRKHMLGKYNLILLSLFQIPRLQQSNINSSEKRPLW